MKKILNKLIVLSLCLIAPLLCLVFSSDIVNAKAVETTEQQETILPIEIGKKGNLTVNGPMVSIKIKNTGLLQLTPMNKDDILNISFELYEKEADEKPFTKGTVSKNNIISFSISKKGTYFLKVSKQEDSSKDVIPIKSAMIPDTDLALKKDKWVSGYYNLAKKKPTFYKVTLPSDGIIKIKGKTNIKLVLYHKNQTMSLSKIKQLDKNNEYKTMFALKAGTYYIKTTSDKEIVSMTYSYLAAKNVSGKQLKGAFPLRLGGNYKKGMILETDTTSNAQWYKCKLTKKKAITINMLLHTEGTNFKVQIYDNKKKPLSSGSIILTDNEHLIMKSPGKWNRGTYYIKITKTSNYGSGYYYLKVK